MIEIENLLTISHYAGNRWDLVQAGGGNASVKVDDLMYIKSSGVLLAELTANKGISIVSLKKLNSLFIEKKIITKNKSTREKVSTDIVSNATVNKTNGKASIETLMHCILNKYVLHTHSVIANVLLCQPDWKSKLKKHFQDAYFIEYATPGIDLALKLNERLTKAVNLNTSKIVFLQNHGVIVAADCHEDLIKINEEISFKLEKLLNIDFTHYHFSGNIYNFYHSSLNKRRCVYYSEILSIKYAEIKNFNDPISPDVFVFCGFAVIEIKSDFTPLLGYIKKNKTEPKVILHNKSYYIIAETIKKAKEIEEVMHFQLSITYFLSKDNLKIETLSKEELLYLENWEAEKYRQNI